MKSRSLLLLLCALAMIPFLMMVSTGAAKDKKPTACSNPKPESLCTAANTCGAGAQCELEVKRADGGTGASVTPTNIEKFQNKGVICVQTGATVVWKGGGKNTGIIVDFGDNSPFDTASFRGGSDSPQTMVAKKAGCYKFSAGACTPGTIYGMCGNSDYSLIVQTVMK